MFCFSWLNKQTDLKVRHIFILLCFVCICGGPCHLCSRKQNSGDQLVYSTMEIITLLIMYILKFLLWISPLKHILFHHQTRISFFSFSLFCCDCSLRAFWVFLWWQKLQQRLTSCRSVNDTVSVGLLQRFLCRCLMWGHPVIDCVPAVVCFNHRLNGESPFYPAALLLSLQSVQMKTLHTDRIAFKVQ